MSRTDLRRLIAIATAAFSLRAGAAVLTEFKPLFPAYYYTDAEFADREARASLAAAAHDERRDVAYSFAQRAHIRFTAALYRVAGPRPLAPKLCNAFAAALGVLAFGTWAAAVFGASAGLIAAGLLALWPSHVFYTSQNFKEGLICAALMGALWLCRPGRTAAAAALLAVLAVLRAPAALAAAAALAAPAAWTFLRPRRAAAGLALALTFAAVAVAAAHWTPSEITAQRRYRQYSEHLYAVGLGREIGTLLFPDERFGSWLDVAAFVPKASFHVLFMPLPGLYPMDGKAGRYLAAAENSLLLILFALAVASVARGGISPERMSPLLFFALMTAASSLLEFDLGGAGRHKLMYLPMLFPFAAEEALRLVRARRNA